MNRVSDIFPVHCPEVIYKLFVVFLRTVISVIVAVSLPPRPGESIPHFFLDVSIIFVYVFITILLNYRQDSYVTLCRTALSRESSLS